jgi:hypothetical protein
MKRSTRRDLIDVLLGGIAILCVSGCIWIVNHVKAKPIFPVDQAKKSSIKLRGVNGSCSGVQIKAKSGQEYILSAGHCAHVGDGQSVIAETEDGRSLERRIIAEDRFSDLLLIEAIPNYPSLQLATEEHLGDKIDTFTHGNGLATYKTSGELIQYQEILVPIKEISSPEDAKKCLESPKNRIQELEFFGLHAEICSLYLRGIVSTAKVVPGSSGGMVVKGDKLVGIVSATDGNFGFFVSLQDLHRFSDNY